MSEDLTKLPLPAGAVTWGTDLGKLASLQEAAEDAANKTPSTVKRALSPREIRVAGRALHKFTVQTYINLEDIGSSFLKRKKEDEKKGEEEPPTVKETIRSLWVLAESDEIVEAAIHQGEEAVRKAVLGFAREINLAEIGEIAHALTLQIALGFEPAAKLTPPAQEGGGAPLESAPLATEPDGS
jgi:hypothetical protein